MLLRSTAEILSESLNFDFPDISNSSPAFKKEFEQLLERLNIYCDGAVLSEDALMEALSEESVESIASKIEDLEQEVRANKDKAIKGVKTVKIMAWWTVGTILASTVLRIASAVSFAAGAAGATPGLLMGLLGLLAFIASIVLTVCLVVSIIKALNMKTKVLEFRTTLNRIEALAKNHKGLQERVKILDSKIIKIEEAVNNRSAKR